MSKYPVEQIKQLRESGKSIKQIISELNLDCSFESLKKVLQRHKVLKMSPKNDNKIVIKKSDIFKTTKLPDELIIADPLGRTFTIGRIAEITDTKKSNLSAVIHGKRNVAREIAAIERFWEMPIADVRKIITENRGN